MARRAGTAKSAKAHGFKGCHRETVMIKQIGEKWRGFWRMASNVALCMDADPGRDLVWLVAMPTKSREPAI